MITTPRHGAACHVIAIVASLTAIAGLGAATRASAQSFVGVDEIAIGGHGPRSKSITSLTPIVVKGKVASDFDFTNPNAHKTDNYTVTAKPGHLSVQTHLTSDGKGNLDGVQVDMRAQFQDSLTVKGVAAGKNVILHKTMAVSGGSSFTKAVGQPNSAIQVASDLMIDGNGAALVPEAPFFPAISGSPAWATMRHTDTNVPNMGLPVDRDLFAPATIDYTILLTGGETGRVFFSLEMISLAFSTGGGVSSYTGGYDVDWDTGPGFFTLADAIGRDTGVRAAPGVSVTSFSRFNYLAPAGQGAAEMDAVPEPAAWALMIGGFGLAGAALRRRRAAACRA